VLQVKRARGKRGKCGNVHGVDDLLQFYLALFKVLDRLQLFFETEFGGTL
jgi:hypothetical protein